VQAPRGSGKGGTVPRALRADELSVLSSLLARRAPPALVVPETARGERDRTCFPHARAAEIGRARPVFSSVNDHLGDPGFGGIALVTKKERTNTPASLCHGNDVVPSGALPKGNEDAVLNSDGSVTHSRGFAHPFRLAARLRPGGTWTAQQSITVPLQYGSPHDVSRLSTDTRQL